MAEQINPEQGSSNTGEKQSSPPYEAALNKAFDKLTSEILIFLLAYTILLIGLAVFGSNIATQFRNLLYIIPVLGVVAYVAYSWLNKPKAQGEARGRGVNVRSRTAEDEAYVGGVRGSTQDIPENVNVTSGRASGKAQVVGIDVGTAGSTRTQELVENFKQLNEANQRELMRSLLTMLDNQEKSNA